MYLNYSNDKILRWEVRVELVWGRRGAYRLLVGKPKGTEMAWNI